MSKGASTEPDDLSSILGKFHMVEGEKQFL